MKKCHHTKKSRYETRRIATDFVSSLDKISNNTGVLRPYYCEWCEGWHLSKQAHEHTAVIDLKHENEFKKYIGE